MRTCAVESRVTCLGMSLLGFLVLACAASPAPGSDAAPAPRSAAAATIAAVMADPLVHRGIRDWGLRSHDLEFAISSLSPQEYATTARMLGEGWRGVGERRAAAQTAHYLVLVTLMRESRLFASVLSTGLR